MNAEPTARASQELPGWTTILDAEGKPVALVRDQDLAGTMLRALQQPVEPSDARRCSGCGGFSRVIDSRRHKSGSIRRRRRCDDCNVAWTTFESRSRPVQSNAA
jgi:hypothetical protein